MGISTGIAVIGPAFVALFLYRPGLVATLDVVKLALLSASLTLPLVIVNFLMIGTVTEARAAGDAWSISTIWAAAAGMTALGLYVILAITWLRGMSLVTFAYLVIGVELVAVALSAVVEIRSILRQRSNR